jgi:hypothetical protein
MMRKVNPIVKLVLELGPVVAFFIAFGRVKDQTFTIAGTEYSGFIAGDGGLYRVDHPDLWDSVGADGQTVQDADHDAGFGGGDGRSFGLAE